MIPSRRAVTRFALLLPIALVACKHDVHVDTNPPTAKSLAEATPDRPLRPSAPDDTARNPAGPPAELDLEKLRLPEGFSIELYTDEVQGARSLALGDDGVVYVSTRRDTRIYAVVDRDGRRVVHTLADDLNTPNGIAYRDGALYVAEIGRVLRYDDITNNLESPPKPVVLTEDLPTSRHHGWRYIAFGPDGWLYIALGAPCNVCDPELPNGTISRMKPDGSGLETYARGVRNSVGFDWHPKTKALWFTDNGRDALGDDLPPGELNATTKPGQHFGFPHCHAGVIVDPDFGRPCTEFRPPEQQLGAHVAPLGMRFYTGAMFPPEYEDAVIFAEHGSWNRTERNGYRVMVVKDGRYAPLVDGFHIAGTDDVMGRPVDVLVLADGSLLVSDDHRGALYRVTYAAP